MLLIIGWLAVLDMPAQTQPVFMRIKGIGTGSNITNVGTDVKLAGGFAYVGHRGGLEIYCVTNPAAPVRVGSWESQLAANAVALEGRYAYLALGAT